MATDPPAESLASAQVYSTTADQYLEHIGDEISSAIEAPLDRAILAAFAEMVAGEATPTGPVADLGCGPGRATAFFADSGLDVVGFDLAPGMIEAARRAHPSLTFEVGSLTAVPLESQSVVAVVCWYSIIHTPADQLSEIWHEIDRLLVPGGLLLLGFQAGDGERIERADAQDSGYSLINFRHAPSTVTDGLEAAGFEILSVATRAAAATHEASPQAFVIGQSPIRK